MDPDHDVVQFRVDFPARPLDAHRVLAHLQPRGRHAAGVRRLPGRNGHAFAVEFAPRLCGQGHIGRFEHVLAAGLDELGGVVLVQFVLRGGRNRDVAPRGPGLLILEPARR